MSEVLEKYVVAVSGGIDSVVLLDVLVNQRLTELGCQLSTTNYQLVIAHVDHGMRDDSAGDAQFVEELAKKYGLPFELYQAELGPKASEAAAREVRYKFLRQCCKNYNASAIITAHHQDDLLETALLNLLRGTGWRGLAPMMQTPNFRHPPAGGSSKNIDPLIKSEDDSGVGIWRPLLGVGKAEILAYAKKHNLEWREDSTNLNQDYLRNYIRHTLLLQAKTHDPGFNKKMLKLIEEMRALRADIESELDEIITNCQLPTANCQLSRYQLIMWPEAVAKEVLYTILRSLDPDWHPERQHIESLLHFCKTGLPGKHYQVSKRLSVRAEKRMLTFGRSDATDVIE